MRRVGLALVVVLAGVWLPLRLRAVSAVTTTYDLTLSQPRTSQPDPNKPVITFEVSGAIRGLLTLSLDGSSGTVTGQWALLAAYADNSGPDGWVPPTTDDDNPATHRDYVRFVDSGTLGGPLTGVVLETGAQGQITGIDMAQAALTIATRSFAGASGSGTLSAAGIDQGGNGAGSLSLTLVTQ
jgi:hypothetical protein